MTEFLYYVIAFIAIVIIVIVIRESHAGKEYRRNKVDKDESLSLEETYKKFKKIGF